MGSKQAKTGAESAGQETGPQVIVGCDFQNFWEPCLQALSAAEKGCQYEEKILNELKETLFFIKKPLHPLRLAYLL